jgi:glycosyltransferase involved in cell wall biosynthesis
MKKISCVICAYNESERIQGILDAVIGHPLLSEIIVVNDGSTDATEKILRACKGIKCITYQENKGKTFALSKGITAAENELVMLIDADLQGITAQDIADLAEPVLSGTADVSMSIRANSLGIYKMLGIDFVSGERVLPRELLEDALTDMQKLPRWGGEVFINNRIVKNKLRLAVVRWHDVYNIRKYTKVGFVRGVKEECSMIYSAFHVLPLWDTCVQILCLLRLKTSDSYSSSSVRLTLPPI